MIRAFTHQTLLAFILFLAVITSVACGAAEPIVTEPTVQPTDIPSATPTTVPTATLEPTAEPTSTPEPTPMPELGQMNEANQWWDGAGWQALPEGEGWQVEVLEDGSVRAHDGSGSMFWVEGQWQTEAQVETRKVVEYVTANSEVINRVPMDWITLRATRELQETVRSGLPPEEQQYESPLFAIVTDVQRLENLLSTFSIDVVGEEGQVSLGDRSQVERVEFVFMSGNEEPGFRLPVNFGHSAVTETQFGAYKSGKILYVVMKLGKYLSTREGYSRADREEGQFFIDGVVNGLWKLTDSDQDIGLFTEKFIYDSAYDFHNPGPMFERTWLVHCVAVRPEIVRGVGFYQDSNFYDDFIEWIPPEFQPIIAEMDW